MILKRFLFIGLLIATANTEAREIHIKQFPLDPNLVYQLEIPYEKGVSTISFPSAISDLAGSNIALERPGSEANQSASDADFVIAYTPNSYFFKVKANNSKASGMLNIVYGRQTYLIHLKASKKPYYSIKFYKEISSRFTSRGSSEVDRTMLMGFLDKAKAYHLLKRDHGSAYAGSDYKKYSPIINQYDGFHVRVEEAWRFRQHDVLVFRLSLVNTSNEEIPYISKRLAVRIGHSIYYQKAIQASGVMPPKSISPIYFAIKGNPDGTRSRLTLNNQWNILIPRRKQSPILETLPLTHTGDIHRSLKDG